MLVSFVGKWAGSEAEPWTEWVGWEAVEVAEKKKVVKKAAKRVVKKKK